MNIFISWSKDKSKKLAEVLKTWLEYLFNEQIDIWTSFDSIEKGQMPIEEIEKALINAEHGIFCLTKDNIKEPWILFEAGAIFRRTEAKKERSNLWSIMFEGDVSLLGTSPLKNFQATQFSEKEMYKLAQTIHNNMDSKVYRSDNLLKEHFDGYWPKLLQLVKQALNDDSIGGGKCLNKENLITVFNESRIFPEPHLGESTFYEHGFEDHPFYDLLLKNAKKRLWFFGRKNKKLFDQRNAWFWSTLGAKVANGFDFRCLFLNPLSSEEIVATAQEKANFIKLLESCIIDSYNTLDGCNVDVGKVCKLYSVVRRDEVVVIDDAVVFSHIGFNSAGFPRHLTNASFNLVDINDAIGKFHKNNFEIAWSGAVNMDKAFIAEINK